MAKSIPYAGAQSGAAARDEITKVLRRFGCESIGFMDNFSEHEVLLAFTHRGRQVQLRASAKGGRRCICARTHGTRVAELRSRSTSRLRYGRAMSR